MQIVINNNILLLFINAFIMKLIHKNAEFSLNYGMCGCDRTFPEICVINFNV